MRSARFVLSGVMLVAIGCFPFRCAAEEFRVETDVFVDGGKEPAVQTLTIFSEGVVYDFLLTGVEEITVFDRDRNRLVLLDTKRKVKTELTLDSILTYVAQMKAHLSEGDQEFLLGEEMKATKDEEGWLSLTNGRVTYRAEGVTPEIEGGGRRVSAVRRLVCATQCDAAGQFAAVRPHSTQLGAGLAGPDPQDD